ncbi:cell envelope integrity protein CreD [Labilibacter sediminis]|nr:cell envelope integrity protein CreD [Labilibacter sediminis]
MNQQEEQSTTNPLLNSLTIKMIVIAAMILLLLIPLGMIKSVIRERESNNREVQLEMMRQWGNQQEISGPILHIPIIQTIQERGESKSVKRWIHIMPEELDIKSNIDPQTRYRGIYKTTVYHSQVNFKGSFSPDYEALAKYDKVLYLEAVISLAITDNRGIKSAINLNWNGTPLEIEPGLKCMDLAKNGVSAPLVIDENHLLNEYPFTLSLHVSGTKSLSFLPIGKTTQVNIESTWPDPSFTGTILPMKRNVTSDGFTAQYETTHLNRSFPQQWLGRSYSINDNTIGVELFIPNNHYQKSLRSAKYGVLFIILTTLIFLFMEISKKKEIHLLQYLLVSLALVLFFSILTALSEHIGFNWAYLLASICTIGLIISYSKNLLKSNQLVTWIGGLLTTLYTFLFVLLQLKDYAFLAGNIGLFIILAVIMRITSNIRFSQKELQ